MIKETSGDFEQKFSLALELTEMGLSLFVCDEDIPVECVAHVSLDDPDFSKKLSTFRNAAEKSVGKGFETHIWLPDEQVMFRSLKLDDDDATDLRKAASSALSASTPFSGDALCFDLGDTNGAGYTPVAAIPKEKMDEAMAFARKMRMNPRQITTSNVVSGFSTRPDFQPFVEHTVKRTAPARMAALAMLLAAPIFLMSTELDGGMGEIPDAGHAFVASIQEVDEIDAVTLVPDLPLDRNIDASQIGVPASFDQSELNRAVPALASHAPSVLSPSVPDVNAAPAMVATQQSVFSMSGTLVATGSDESSVLLSALDQPTGMPHLPELFGSHDDPVYSIITIVQSNVLQPTPPNDFDGVLLISESDGMRAIPTGRPDVIFEAFPDKLPSLGMLSVEYVQNVFDENIEIHDLIAVDETSQSAFSGQNFDPSYIRVANFGEGVLVRRPEMRSAPKLVQPAFMPRPEKRPLPLLPEQAFDYNSILPIDPAITVEDPPPTVSRTLDETAILISPEGLFLRLDDATLALIDKADQRRREVAIRDAETNKTSPLARLISPQARDAVPLAGSNGALVQFKLAQIAHLEEVKRTNTTISDRFGRRAQHRKSPSPTSMQLAQLSLPSSLPEQERIVPIVRELVPYKPGFNRTDGGSRFADREISPTIIRPPSRQQRAADLSSDESIVQEKPSQIIAEGENGEVSIVVDDEGQPQSERHSPSMQAQIAAAAAPKLNLPRPPARPDQTTDVAALIKNLDPVPEISAPISKYAIDTLHAPIKRPAGLQARAEKVLEERNSVSHQVAKKQEPVATTPQNRLRIPTGTRVGAAATIKDGIALGDISLIGIYGTSKTRRALVRLPQGRYVQISRGDSVSGWTVSAVGEDAVRIQKGSKNKVLRLPN